MTEYERTQLIQQPLRPPYLADTLIISQDASKTEIKYLITDINFNASGNRPLKWISTLSSDFKNIATPSNLNTKIILITHLRSILVKQKKSSQKSTYLSVFIE